VSRAASKKPATELILLALYMS